jgi:hypothetical protein
VKGGLTNQWSGPTSLTVERQRNRALEQGCKIFLGPNIPNWEKYTKLPQTIPNGHKF